MNVKDVFITDGRLWLRRLEKGGKVLEVPCHHNLESYLREYIEAAGIASDRDGPLFRSLNRDGSLSGRRLVRQRAWELLRRRARVAGISTDVCNHSFRATGITLHLENPEARVEVAQYLAGHADPKTIKLYDRALSASSWMKSRGSGFEETTTVMGEQGRRMAESCVFDQDDSRRTSVAQSAYFPRHAPLNRKSKRFDFLSF